ncbi:phage integrase family protein, partial [Escherichia coli 95.0943]
KIILTTFMTSIRD